MSKDFSARKIEDITITDDIVLPRIQWQQDLAATLK